VGSEMCIRDSPPALETPATLSDDENQGSETKLERLPYQKYEHILELFREHVAPKSDAREITTEDIKKFLAWRKSKGFDPGTTLYTDRVIIHNFFSKLKIDNPVKEVSRFQKFRKKPVAFTDEELKKFFGVCTPWEWPFFALAIHPRPRQDRCKTRGTQPQRLARHRFRDTAATRWLRAGIDVRTVQTWLGHESLDTTQKYLEPSKATEKQLEKLKLPCNQGMPSAASPSPANARPIRSPSASSFSRQLDS